MITVLDPGDLHKLRDESRSVYEAGKRIEPKQEGRTVPDPQLAAGGLRMPRPGSGFASVLPLSLADSGRMLAHKTVWDGQPGRVLRHFEDASRNDRHSY